MDVALAHETDTTTYAEDAWKRGERGGCPPTNMLYPAPFNPTAKVFASGFMRRIRPDHPKHPQKTHQCTFLFEDGSCCNHMYKLNSRGCSFSSSTPVAHFREVHSLDLSTR